MFEVVVECALAAASTQTLVISVLPAQSCPYVIPYVIPIRVVVCHR